MIDFDASEIASWANPNQFPQLISKLILATTPATLFIDMPSGSAVWLPGWDGCLKSMAATHGFFLANQLGSSVLGTTLKGKPMRTTINAAQNR